MFLLFLLIARIIVTSPVYDSFEVSEEKVSEICSYLAKDCSTCVQYQSCFWCPSDQYNKQKNSAGGTCMANYDKFSRYNCWSRKVYSFKSKEQCPNTSQFLEKETEHQLRLLVKLLKLLKHFHQLRNNSSKPAIMATTQSVFLAKIINKTILPTKFANKTTYSVLNITSSNSTTNIRKESNKTSDVFKIFTTNKTTTLKPYSVNKTLSTASSTTNPTSTTMHPPKDCNTNDMTVCSQQNSCTWQNDKCILVKRSMGKLHLTEVTHCVSKRTCGACTESLSCYWCDRSKTCHTFTSTDLIPHQCKDSWYHGECSYKKSVFLVIIPTISIIIFLSIAYVCLKNCYYHQLRPVEVKLEERPILFKEKNGKTVYQITESEDEDDDRRIIAEKSDLFW